MIGVGRVGPFACGQQHQTVGQQIRQCVHGIGHQTEGVGEQADNQLQHGQRQVGGHRDERDLLGLARALGVVNRHRGGLGFASHG